jgi:hypothetical protein
VKLERKNPVSEKELWKSKRDLVINQVPITTKQARHKYRTQFVNWIESKRDLVINQVPFTTKPEVNNVLPKTS